jgi:hypothetical protein
LHPITYVDKVLQRGLPEHDLPFPENPALQAHVYPPAVFVQVAFAWQSLALAHSSISVSKQNPYNMYKMFHKFIQFIKTLKNHNGQSNHLRNCISEWYTGILIRKLSHRL